jgi:membrane protease YdiL (CAAX protease family)
MGINPLDHDENTNLGQPHSMNDQPNDTPNKEPGNDPLSWSPVTDAMRHGHHGRVTKQGNPVDAADPGSGFSRLVALLVTIVIVSSVVLWQNTSEEIKHKLFFQKPIPVTQLEPDQLAPGSYGQVDLIGRIYLRGFEMLKNQPVLSQLESEGVALIPEDKVRVIMLAGEFAGDEAALERIALLRAEIAERRASGVESESDTRQIEDGDIEFTIAESLTIKDLDVIDDELITIELNALETIYTVGIDALEPEQIKQLQDRYGLIGKVAVTHGLSDTDPSRAPLITGIMPLVLFMLLVGCVILLGPLLGLILLIFGVVQLSMGKMKYRNHVPMKGGSVFLETYAVFVGGFLVMAVGTFYVAYSGNPALAGFSLLAQWVLLLTVLWALIRGMNSSEWRQAIGLHAGEGVFKEIGCGIVAYLASIPIYIIGVIITIILLLVSELIKTSMNPGAPIDPEPVTNPIFEIVASGDILTIVMLYVLATVWAPLAEETIFRGALFRHLRSSMHWVFAGLISAFLFAFMHDYGPLMVAPLIALGFMFAFMREWRGSLIAPITAHFLHNFTLMTFMIVLVQLIKDPI